MYVFIVLLFSVDWLSEKLGILPRETTYFAELAAVIITVVIVTSLANRRRMDIDGRTAAILCFLLVSIIASAIINTVPSGVLINGLRLHLKFLPFFLLPLAYEFSSEQIKRQLGLLLALTVIQVPVALYQRFIKYSDIVSADGVGGTLGPNSSGTLSVWLACSISLILAAHLNGLLKKATALGLIVALSVPTMINETKISFIIIPLAVLVPVMFWSKNKEKLGQIALAVGLVVAFFAVLFPVYDSFRSKNSRIADFFLTEDIRTYVYRGDQSGGAGNSVRRLDSVALAAKNLNHENAILFGVGIGNISPSFSPEFDGEYHRRYNYLFPNRTHMSTMLWETGVVGSTLYIILLINCMWTSIVMRNDGDTVIRSLALGWIGISMIVLMTLVYFKLYSINLFNCLFWFYSGQLIAQYSRERSQSGVLTGQNRIRQQYQVQTERPLQQ